MAMVAGAFVILVLSRRGNWRCKLRAAVYQELGQHINQFPPGSATAVSPDASLCSRTPAPCANMRLLWRRHPLLLLLLPIVAADRRASSCPFRRVARWCSIKVILSNPAGNVGRASYIFLVLSWDRADILYASFGMQSWTLKWVISLSLGVQPYKYSF